MKKFFFALFFFLSITLLAIPPISHAAPLIEKINNAFYWDNNPNDLIISIGSGSGEFADLSSAYVTHKGDWLKITFLATPVTWQYGISHPLNPPLMDEPYVSSFWFNTDTHLFYYDKNNAPNEPMIEPPPLIEVGDS